MKAIEQYFMFFMLYKVVVTCEFEVLFIKLYKVVLSFESGDEAL